MSPTTPGLLVLVLLIYILASNDINGHCVVKVKGITYFISSKCVNIALSSQL